jgi:formiminotetrahydrofolate cyclodeaminase
MCSRLAVRAAGLNVRINLKDLADGAARAAFQERTRALERRAEAAETAVLQRIALD